MKTKISIPDLYRTDPRAACRRALRETIRIPARDRLDAIDRLLETYGTEAIRGDWQNGYWCDIAATYCNTGDMYTTTVIHDRDRGFFIGNVGDYVERNERRLGIL